MAALRAHDCQPTLTDSQVLTFCRNGFMVLEAVVPDEINQRTLAFMESHPQKHDAGLEPTELLTQGWFMDNVILNASAAGAVRALLGADFHVPIIMSSHRRVGPRPSGGPWHIDSNYLFRHELHDLQVFYYPQDTPAELGPTQLFPGSHFLRNQQRFMQHLDRIRGSVMTAAPAGSIVITIYQIWHRSSPLLGNGTRNLLKYVYWRTSPPKRDWIIEPDFDFAHVDYEGESAARRAAEGAQISRDTAKLFYWLCGMADKYRVMGGQSWPQSGRRMGEPYGFPGPHRPRAHQDQITPRGTTPRAI